MLWHVVIAICDLWELASLSLLLSLEIIKYHVLQILVNYARSSAEAEEVCKEVNYQLYQCIMYFLARFGDRISTSLLQPYPQNSFKICRIIICGSLLSLLFELLYILGKTFSNPKHCPRTQNPPWTKLLNINLVVCIQCDISPFIYLFCKIY